MKNLLQDLRFALRQVRRSPGFALTAVLTLALGIAANVIVFGVLQAMVLRPLDVPQPERMMQLQPTNLGVPLFAYPEVRDVREQNTVFSAVAAHGVQNFGLEANGVTRPVWGLEVSGQYFDVVSIKPFLGRLLQPSDDAQPCAPASAVLSWAAWKSEFEGDPNIVGKAVRINKQPYTVVGVTPPGFFGTEKFLQPEIFVSMANEVALEGVSWREQRHDKNVFAMVRLKDGVTVPQALAELNTIAARMRQQYPKDEEGMGFKLGPPGLIGDFLGGPVRGFLAGVMGLAAILLLAACANLGSLFAARTADRTREIAIRMAIGSSRWRVLRQVMVEAFVISIFGGICACALAWAALTALASWHPPSEYPIGFAVLPQPSLILISMLISAVAAVVFGVMPLRQIFKTDPNEAIKGGGNQSAPGRRWALRDFLLAAQIALCCVTVTAAFVALRGLGNTLSIDLGFKPQQAVRVVFDLSQAGYSVEAASQLQRELLRKVAQLPGVKAAGYGDTTPLSSPPPTDIYAQQTADLRPSNKVFSSYDFGVSPGYFAAAGTPLLEGRDVSFTDTAKTPLVAVVNLQFVRQLFHTDHAVGRYFKNHSGVPIQIVGIVGDGKYLSISEDASEAVFFPILQQPDTDMALVVQPRGDLAAMAATVRKMVRDTDPTIPIREASVWNSQLALLFFPAQMATIALSIFGAFGLLLSVAGTFGLASYTVSKRLRELSIRVALGAQAKEILATALGRMLVLIACGSFTGIVLGVAASRLLAAIVYHASAEDPFVLAAVSLIMLATGLLSVAGPVRRTLQIDPAILLREQ
jgi:predicted permease